MAGYEIIFRKIRFTGNRDVISVTKQFPIYVDECDIEKVKTENPIVDHAVKVVEGYLHENKV